MMMRSKSKFGQGATLVILVVAILSGCAARQMHNDGLDLVQQGMVEEGIQKLEQASRTEPENVTYRSDYLRSKGEVTNRLLANASGERGLGHLDAAQAIYERVLKVDPDNRNARSALDALAMDRRHDAMIKKSRSLFKAGNLEAARAALKPVFLENPKHGQAAALLRKIDEQYTKIRMAGPTLKGKFKKPISLQFRDANVKKVFEALARMSGLNILLDKDVRTDIKISIFVKNVSVEDAVDLILMQGKLEKKILGNNTVYIYPDTQPKNKEFQDLKIRSFHLTNADPKQMLTMIKTLLKTKDIFIHEKTNSLVMRDTPAAIQLAEKLIADQDIADPEVMLEVEILEISRSRLSEIGVKFPSQLSFTALPSTITTEATNTTAAVSKLSLFDLRNIDGSTIITDPALSITLNAMLQDSDTNILSSPRLRVRNREKAKIMIGERVPIINNSLTPTATGSPVVTGTVTYQDVGLKLDVQPEIHLDNEVTIKIGLEVSSLGLAVSNSAGSQVYRIGTRNTSTSLRLRNGETQILAGLITDEDRSTVDKVPALGQLPLLGRLFSNDKGGKSKTEIILSITPHIVGNSKVPDARETEYWSGTEASLRSNRLMLSSQGTIALDNSGAAGATASMAIPSFLLPRNNAPAREKQAAAPAVPQSMSFTWQGPDKVRVGDRIVLSMLAQSTLGAKALGFKVNFDPVVLKAVDAVEGGSLKQKNVRSTFTKNMDQTPGEIAVEMSGAGAANPATVVTLMFDVIAPAAAASVAINSIKVTGANGEAIAAVAPVAHVIAVTQK